MKYNLTITDDEGEVVKNETYNSPMDVYNGIGIEVSSLTLNDWGQASHELAMSKGFDSVDPKEKLLLIHAEVSEILEAIREEPKPSAKVPMITCEAEEVADVFIRLAQYAKIRGIDFDLAVRLKHGYNADRPWKHGKKF